MKINLHCHSFYSDGKEPLAVMLMEHKKQGFSAFVISDHYEMTEDVFLTDINFKKQRKELYALGKYLEYPVIQGIELNLGKEEILVFGIELIRKIFAFASSYNETNIYEDALKMILDNKNLGACVLCHPCLQENLNSNYYKLLFDVVDGFEVYNAGINWFKDRKIPSQLWSKHRFDNSDAHLLFQIETGMNEHTRPIKTEQDLISYIKGIRR